MEAVAPVERLRLWARSIRRDVLAMHLAARDPRVPWYAKAAVVCIAAYAFSPIDLIPDFIPVLGQLDELIVLPLLIVLAARLIEPAIMAEHRLAAARAIEQPSSRAGAILVVTIWLLLLAAAAWITARLAFANG